MNPWEIADLIRQLLSEGFTLQQIAAMFPPKAKVARVKAA